MPSISTLYETVSRHIIFTEKIITRIYIFFGALFVAWLLQVEGGKGRKSKEQLEAEKRAILKQRVKPLEVDGLDSSKLSEKAKELHTLIYRLEGEKYDLEKRFKAQQIDVSRVSLLRKCNIRLMFAYVQSGGHQQSAINCDACCVVKKISLTCKLIMCRLVGEYS
jgi:Troponin